MKATTEVLLVDSDPLRTVSLCDHHTVVTLKQGNALHTNDETPSSEDCEMCDTDSGVDHIAELASMLSPTQRDALEKRLLMHVMVGLPSTRRKNVLNYMREQARLSS